MPDQAGHERPPHEHRTEAESSTAPLITEQINPGTVGFDELPTLEMIRLINNEDKLVAEAVEKALPSIAAAIDAITDRLRGGGRLFYVGTGTSGRLGVLDAVECPPTFGVSPALIQAILAGGFDACWRAVELAEDDPQAGAAAIEARGVSGTDAVVGLTASGRTPFTLGALEKARSLGAFTVGIACNPDPELTRWTDICITPVVGPEVIAGSTRLKAGTAQKMVINMLSTGAMIRLGYTYGNLMSNLQLKNEKLRRRARLILQQQFDLQPDEAIQLLEVTQWDLKAAIVMKEAGVSLDQARIALAVAGSSIKSAIRDLKDSAMKLEPDQ
jgi:N-acetylmuramic acid 6-phosphate etherase